MKFYQLCLTVKQFFSSARRLLLGSWPHVVSGFMKGCFSVWDTEMTPECEGVFHVPQLQKCTISTLVKLLMDAAFCQQKLAGSQLE